MLKNISFKKIGLFLVIVLVSLLFVYYISFAIFTIFINKNNFGANIFINGSSYSLKNINSVTNSLNEQLKNKQIEVIVESTGTKQVYSASDLGVYYDSNQLEQVAKTLIVKSLLLPFPLKQNITYYSSVDQQKLASQLEKLNNSNPAKPINSTYSVNAENQVVISESQAGSGIAVQEFANKLIVKNINELPSSLTPAIQTIDARLNKDSLEPFVDEVSALLKNTYILQNSQTNIPLDISKIVSFYEPQPSNNIIVLTVNKLLADDYLKQVLGTQNIAPKDSIVYTYKSGKASTTTTGQDGVAVSNTEELVAIFNQSLNEKTSYLGIITTSPVPFKTVSQTIDDTKIKRYFTYSVATWGTINSDINEFKNLSAETLNDSKGWNRAGVAFSEVPTGGDFTLVLAEPATIPANFPGTCDSTYSCQVGRFVIINDDRWRLASSAWTGELRDYRHMVVNHETGHWLGQSHKFCQGAGQPAPVMQQQSINLQGCTFNPWPLDFEINLVSSRY
jgi:hypothetical protein